MGITDEEIFGDGPTETIEVVEAQPEPEPEVKEELTGEKEEVVEAEATEQPQEESPSPEESQVPITALHGERDRRKVAEARAKELEAQLETKKDPTSVFEDENAFRQEMSADFNQKLTNTVLSLTENFARRTHGDEVVDQAIDWFKDAARETPLLQQRFNEAGNDVETVVSLYKSHKSAEELQDVDAYKAKLRAEVEAEVKAELEGKAASKSKLRDSIPESLVGEPSAGAPKAEVALDTSDEAVFG